MQIRGILREYAGVLNVIARFLDLVSVLLGGLLAFLWRFGHVDIPVPYRIAILIALLTTALFFPIWGIYKSWRGRGQWAHARSVILAWGTVITGLLILAYLSKTGALISRKWTLAWAIYTGLLLLGTRYLVWQLLHLLRKKGLNKRRVIIYGTGTHACEIKQRLDSASWTGMEIIGFVDDVLHLDEFEEIPVLGGISQLSDIVRDRNVDEVWIALSLSKEDKVQKILHELRFQTVNIRYVPDISDFRMLNHSITEIAGFPVLNLTETPMHGLNRFIKSVEDKLLSITILILVSPLMLLLGIGVKLSSPGPVFYRQERVGWNGKPFTMLKFRSMPVDVEKTEIYWGGEKEKTNTKFGLFIRKTSLDELPQFINVIKGDMSIVGPRPERTVFVEKFKNEIPNYMMKHLVKAGITGWAQVNGWRGDTDLKKRVEYDLFYIEHWSLWFDLRIILMTIFLGFIQKKIK